MSGATSHIRHSNPFCPFRLLLNGRDREPCPAGTVGRCEGHRSGRWGRRRPFPARGSAAARPGPVCPTEQRTGPPANRCGQHRRRRLDPRPARLPGPRHLHVHPGRRGRPQRGWGHRDETWHAMEELAHYGVRADWFHSATGTSPPIWCAPRC